MVLVIAVAIACKDVRFDPVRPSAGQTPREIFLSCFSVREVHELN